MALTVELTTPVTGAYQQPIGLYIDGKWVEGVDKQKFEVINPSTEEVITSVCDGTEKDIDLAVSAARKAFDGEWRKTAPQTRGNLLLSLLLYTNILTLRYPISLSLYHKSHIHNGSHH
jgi:aldehyde dehydrogenase (NAD+)